MAGETTTGSGLKVKAGEVYVPKGRDEHYDAIIIRDVHVDNMSYSDTSGRNKDSDFTPRRGFGEGGTWASEEAFLQMYERAKPEQLIRILSELEDARRVANNKVTLLRDYCRGLESVSQVAQSVSDVPSGDDDHSDFDLHA